ncbi:hypothetical protein G6F56_013437 [Rhizopus delemar]|nr:hypothetical protein G6F56_013437 [Rhizopus delemar]
MSVMNKNLDINVRVSVSAHYLKSTRAPELLQGRVEFAAPKLRFKGKIMSHKIRDDGKVMYGVILDDLPDNTFELYSTSLKYDGSKKRSDFPAVSIGEIVVQAEEDLLEDAEEQEEEEEEVDLTLGDENGWRVEEANMDTRITSVQGFSR